MILSYTLKPYRPRVTLGQVREIFAFSGWMSLATMVTTLSMQTDRIIVGRLLGVGEAGSYFMTQRVGALPTSELVGPLQRILFPSLREIAKDEPHLRRTVLEAINVLASLSLPVATGFAVTANDLVPLVLGDQWIHVVPLLWVLVPFLGARATLSMTQPTVMALGRTRLLFQVSVLYALVHLPAFIMSTRFFGLKGAIWSIVLAGFFYWYLSAWLLRQTLRISLFEILGQMRRPALATLCMLAVMGIAWLGSSARVLLIRGKPTRTGYQDRHRRNDLWPLPDRSLAARGAALVALSDVCFRPSQGSSESSPSKARSVFSAMAGHECSTANSRPPVAS